MTDPQLLQQNMEFLFRQWWAESYPTTPGNHAVMTHSAFAASIYESIFQAGVKSAGEYLLRISLKEINFETQQSIARAGTNLINHPDSVSS
jgi:hypothetical protein